MQFINNIIDVQIYDIENQGKNQENVPMLISTVPLYRKTAESFMSGYYSDKNGDVRYHRRSFSLINEKKLQNLFCKNRRIAFGFEDLLDRKLISASLIDGGTGGNDVRFRKRRRVRKNTLLPVNQFVDKTRGHNEILLEMDGTNIPIKPSFILISEKEPTQLEIDIAAFFDIPIKYINIEKYQQLPNIDERETSEYNYYIFEKKAVNKQDLKQSKR